MGALEILFIIIIKNIIIIAFLLGLTFKRGPWEVAVLCDDMHNLMPMGFLMFLSVNDFLPGCLFAVVI